MTETIKKSKEIKSNPFERKSKFGHWIETKNNEYFWEETAIKEIWSKDFNTWIRDSETTSLKTPQEFGLKRTAEITVLFCREYENRSEFNGVLKTWFVQKMTYTMRSDMTNNLWFIESDGRLFIRDLHGQGVCAPVSINQSSPNFICKTTKPQKVSAEEAQALQKQSKTAYVFNKVENWSKR